MAATDIAVARLPADFGRWDELLDVIRASFSYMDGVIDPPSSVHRLTPESLGEKAKDEVCFLATEVSATPPTPGPSPQGGGEPPIVGCVFLAEKADHFYLGKLAVLPTCQGKGVGRALMAAAEDHAARAGKPVIELQTRIELTANHRTFAALGFVETARTAHEGYTRPTSITMRKRLA